MRIFRRKVLHGKHLGHLIGFPTINLNVGHLARHHEPGVYLAEVKVGKTWHRGMAHFGAKHNAPHVVLEIYIDDFNQDIYGHMVSFRLGKKIRDVMPFRNLEELEVQLQKDLVVLQASSR